MPPRNLFRGSYQYERAYRAGTSRSDVAQIYERSARRGSPFTANYYDNAPPFSPVKVTERYDPRSHPHAKPIEHESKAQRAYNEQFEDARDRFAINKMLNKAIDIGIDLGVHAIIPRPLDMAIEGFEFVGSFISAQTQGRIVYPAGWTVVGQCSGGTGNAWFNHSSAGGAYSRNCLAGQGGDPLGSIGEIPSTSTHAVHGMWNGTRYQHIVGYEREFRAGSASGAYYQSPGPNRRFNPVPKPFRLVNPNVHRYANPTPQPFRNLDVAPTVTPSQQAVEITWTGDGIAPPRSGRTLQASRSQPPKGNVKERKAKAAQVGAALFNILDKASEFADAIDSLYQALPEDVRVRWNRPLRAADTNGQYGVSGADWKIQALYHNWHRLDVAEAVKNLLYNEVEDALYGKGHAAKDRLTGRGRHRKRGPFG